MTKIVMHLLSLIKNYWFTCALNTGEFIINLLIIETPIRNYHVQYLSLGKLKNKVDSYFCLLGTGEQKFQFISADSITPYNDGLDNVAQTQNVRWHLKK